MSVSANMIRHQLPVLRALGETVAAAALQRLRPRRPTPELPGPWLEATAPPRPRALLEAYAAHLDLDPAQATRWVPPHLFPQWTFPLAGRALRGLPFPLLRTLNAGCRLEVRAPLAADAPLVTRARLEAVERDERRARLTQRILTGTPDAPDALAVTLHAVVRLGGAGEKNNKQKKTPLPPRPEGLRVLETWSIDARAGRDFALLTGDLNPIHWVQPWAKRSGFGGVILHGFSTLARAWEGLRRARAADAARPLTALDVRFTRPLVIPARVCLMASDAGDVLVTGAPGDPEAPVFMAGHVEAS